MSSDASPLGVLARLPSRRSCCSTISVGYPVPLPSLASEPEQASHSGVGAVVWLGGVQLEGTYRKILVENKPAGGCGVMPRRVSTVLVSPPFQVHFAQEEAAVLRKLESAEARNNPHATSGLCTHETLRAFTLIRSKR